MIALAAILFPLVAAGLLFLGSQPGRFRLALLPLAPVPALGLALWGDGDGTRSWDWLLLGSELGVAHSGPSWLFFTAALWVVGGWYAAHYVLREWTSRGALGNGQAQVGAWFAERRFCVFWLMTLAGNLGLVLAGDLPTFYTAFAFMTFSAYGLVVSSGTPEAWRAGRVYIVLAVIGEAMLVGAFLLAVAGAESYLLKDVSAAVASSPSRDLIILLGFAGFAVKAGVFPLHFWLPLAHPVAPTPASAVLSGVMIKAGLLGWMQFLPGGHDAFPGWSLALIVLGALTAFYAVGCGLAQRNLKTILAYSSVSQMGLMLLVVGAGLGEPTAWEATRIVIIVYALNHAFSKGALFLGAGLCHDWSGASLVKRYLFLAGLAVPALAIAGAPMMGGAIAKEAVKIATEVPAETAPWLKFVLPLSAVATTVLLGRFLWLARREVMENREPGRNVPDWQFAGLLAAWGLLLGACVFGVYFAIPWYALELETAEPSWYGLWENLWPILAGCLLLAPWVTKGKAASLRIPAGDVVVVWERILRMLQPRLAWAVHAERWRINIYPTLETWAQGRALQKAMSRAETFFKRKETFGFFMMVFVLVVWLLLRF